MASKDTVFSVFSFVSSLSTVTCWPLAAYAQAVLITFWGPNSVICFALKSMLTNTNQRRTRTLLKQLQSCLLQTADFYQKGTQSNLNLLLWRIAPPSRIDWSPGLGNLLSSNNSILPMWHPFPFPLKIPGRISSLLNSRSRAIVLVQP